MFEVLSEFHVAEMRAFWTQILEMDSVQTYLFRVEEARINSMVGNRIYNGKILENYLTKFLALVIPDAV